MSVRGREERGGGEEGMREEGRGEGGGGRRGLGRRLSWLHRLPGSVAILREVDLGGRRREGGAGERAGQEERGWGRKDRPSCFYVRD